MTFRTFLRRTAAAVVAAATVLGAATVPTATATAEELPGYVDLREPDAYMDPGASWTVLHVDTEHRTSEGFWYAVAEDNSYLEEDVPIPVRNMVWRFQPWGTWCDSSYKKVEWNTWLGGWRCGPDTDKLQAAYGDYLSQRDACRARTGREYTDAVPNGESGGSVTWTCDDWVIDDTRLTNSNSNYIRPSERSYCAPWEHQEPDGYGYQGCYHEFYSWLNDPAAPDGGYLTEPAGITKTVTATRTATRTTDVRRARSATTTVTRRVVRRTATGRVDGVRRTVTGKAPVRITRTARAARTRSATADATRRATRTCTAPTEAKARDCARANAARAARSLAVEEAVTAATRVATRRAIRAAKVVAIRKARRSANAAPIPRRLVRSAARLAQQRADAKLTALRR